MQRNWIRNGLMLVACSAFAAPAAFAQNSGSAGGGAAQSGGANANVSASAGGAGGAGGANTFINGTLQGTIQNVDLEHSRITISTAAGPLAGQGQQGQGQQRGGQLGEQQGSQSMQRGGNAQGGAMQGGLASGAEGGGNMAARRTVTLQARPFDIANFNPGDVVALHYNDYNGVLWLQPTQGTMPIESWAQSGTITGPVTAVNRARGVIEVRGETFRVHPQQTQGVFPGQFISLQFAQVGQEPWVSAIGPGNVQPQQQQQQEATGTGSSSGGASNGGGNAGSSGAKAGGNAGASGASTNAPAGASTSSTSAKP